MNRGSLIKAALLGGILSALLTALPLVGVLCCVWVTAGGAFAAWVVASDSQRQAGGGRMAFAGFLSGVVGGLLAVPATQISSRLQAGEGGLEQQAEEVRRGLAPTAEQLPPEMVEAMVRGFLGLEFNVWTVAMMLLFVLLFCVFGLFGGLLGGAMFGRGPEPQPPPPPVLPSPLEPPSEQGELEPDELPPLPDATPPEEAGEEVGWPDAPTAPPPGDGPGRDWPDAPTVPRPTEPEPEGEDGEDSGPRPG